MKTILVPTDFSKIALNAVKYAFSYAEKTKSKIILFNSYNDPTSEIMMPFFNIHYGKQEARFGAEEKMKKQISSLKEIFPKVKPKWVVQPGIGSEKIIEYVKDNKIDLVIMGTTGQGAVSRAIIGSTTSGVITDAPCAIIAVPPKARFKGVNGVAVATDLQKDSLLPIEDVVLFAKQLRAEVKLIHVQDFEIEDPESKLQVITDKIKAKTKYQNVSFYVVRAFNIADGIDAYIKKFKPDMISLVTHSRKFPETIWESNWTKKMANHVSIPLLVLHAPIKKDVKKEIKKIEINY